MCHWAGVLAATVEQSKLSVPALAPLRIGAALHPLRPLFSAWTHRSPVSPTTSGLRRMRGRVLWQASLRPIWAAARACRRKHVSRSSEVLWAERQGGPSARNVRLAICAFAS